MREEEKCDEKCAGNPFESKNGSRFCTSLVSLELPAICVRWRRRILPDIDMRIVLVVRERTSDVVTPFSEE